jgi:hypothetical protein
MSEHAGAKAINDLRSAVVNAQHNITSKSAFWEILTALSGADKVQALGIAKGSVPVKADYDTWLKSQPGLAAEQKLNAAYNALVKKLHFCYQGANTTPPVLDKIKTNAKNAVLGAETFLSTYHIPHSHAAEIDKHVQVVKGFENIQHL